VGTPAASHVSKNHETWCTRHYNRLTVSPRKRKAPTLGDAKRAANALRRAFPRIDGVFLYGSVARGDADQWSDIDLIITGSGPDITPERLRQTLSRHGVDRISLIYYPTSVFRRHYRERALFIAHLKKEGVALYDRLGLLQTVLRKPFVPIIDVSEGIRSHLTKLAPYADPMRFNNNFLFCLAHVYSIGKGVIMLGLAHRGVLEFNREAAFKRFVALNPDLKKEIGRVTRLRPFYNLVTGRHPEQLPFSYKSASRQLRDAVTAVRRLAERAEVL